MGNVVALPQRCPHGSNHWSHCKYCARQRSFQVISDAKERLQVLDRAQLLRKLSPKEIEESWLLEEKISMARRSLERTQ